ncbi:MAG: hypothetical protein HOO93_02955 [Methyloglobulus sp.]|nr:hypothetical protein [Methyloglobulus sp.]
MKKLLFILLLPLFLVACSDKNHYEQVVLEEMEKEKDVRDYKIEPAHMAKCVIDTTYLKMPGFFAFDPDRLAAYRNYAKMLTLTKEKDPKETLAELRKAFGSPQELAKAHTNYTESIMDCYTAIMHEQDNADEQSKP